MRILQSLSILSLCGAAGLAAAEGLRWTGSRLLVVAQTRLQINAVVLDTTLNTPRPMSGPPCAAGASLGGDYYFSRAPQQSGLPQSGFRASSALLIRQPGVSLSELAWSSRSMASFGGPSRLTLGNLGASAYDTGTHSLSTLPYLGIGYSDYSLKTGWGFWADVGLVVQNPGSALGLGRTLSGTQGVDDLVRELQLSPMVQMGGNYSFSPLRKALRRIKRA